VKRKYAFTPWHVEGGRLITNGRVRFYLAGCREQPTQVMQYEPCWLDRLADAVCEMLNATSDTGEYITRSKRP
jgi:hypothetical protein